MGNERAGQQPSQSLVFDNLADRITSPGKSTLAGNAADASAQPAPPVKHGEGRTVLTRAVSYTEGAVGQLRADWLGHTFGSPQFILTTVATAIEARLREAREAVTRDPGEPAELDALGRRLDVSIGKLDALAHQFNVPMKEAHLEAIFDLEDDILRTCTGMVPPERANAYYNQRIAPIERGGGATDSAQSMSGRLQGDAAADNPASAAPASATPVDRDSLVARIQADGHDLAQSLRAGFEKAKSVLNEGDEPEAPDFVERLLEVAVSLLATNAIGMLGAVLHAGFARVIAGKVNSEAEGEAKGLGDKITDIFVDGFTDVAKENIVAGAKQLTTPGSPAEGNRFWHAASNSASNAAEQSSASSESSQPKSSESGESKLKPKTLYLNAAIGKTSEAISQINARFANETTTLKRTPVVTLKSVSDCFTKDLQDQVAGQFADLIVNEWLNFGRSAWEQGVDVREGKKRESHWASESKLDLFYGLPKFGFVLIGFGHDQSNDFVFQHATIPGASDAVLEHLQKERNSLAALRVMRKVRWDRNGGFTIDPSNKISIEIDSDDRVRREWAKLANPAIQADHVSDDEVHAGVQTVVKRLDALHCDLIRGGS